MKLVMKWFTDDQTDLCWCLLREVKDMFLLNVFVVSYFLYAFPLLQPWRPIANILTDSKHCQFSAIMNQITAFLLMILIGKVNSHIQTNINTFQILYLTTSTTKHKSFSTGHSTSDHLQTIVCPYENRNISQNRRVWCKRDVQDENCCTGFSFQPGNSVLEDGNIQVQDDGKSFTVSVKTLGQGDGVYWCGFMTEDKIIVKLAEDYFSTGKMKCYFSISL